MSDEKNPENKDLLGHKVYVDKILDKITKNKPDFKKESFVIGLEGEWGIGKSWILKRLIEELEKNDYEDSIINLDSWTSFGYKYFIENYYKELRNKSLNPFLKGTRLVSKH
jgi:predicted KAP-like P-loop ATPase